jgi:hypothetical protein
MMFATCRACGAAIGSPCYAECPVTRHLGEAAANERALTERIVKGLRRRTVGDWEGEGEVRRYVATPSGQRRIDGELRRFFQSAPPAGERGAS